MAVEDLKADLRQYFLDARETLDPLDVDLRGQAVLTELANPAGLQDRDDDYEQGIVDILRTHAAEGALNESIAAAEVLAELRTPEANTRDGDFEPPPIEGELPAPVLTAIDPTTGFTGNATLPLLTATGSDFHPTSVIRFQGIGWPTTFVSTSELTVPIPYITQAGPVNVTVDTGGLISQPQTFTYEGA
jgi:hypothetical protein